MQGKLNLFAILLLLAACGREAAPLNTAVRDPLVTEASVPAGEFYLSSTEEITLPGKGYQWGDGIVLVAGDERIDAIVTDVDPCSVTIYLPRSLKTASWRIILVRDGVEQVLGYIDLKDSISLDIPDKAGMTVKGAVFCGRVPIPGVVVSDGVEVVRTDADGYYWMKSAKRHGYVFVSVPNGYEPATGANGMPEHWKSLKTRDDTVEQVDFELHESAIAPDGSFTLLAFADMHLAHRTTLQDEKQFASGFIPDVRAFAEGAGRPVIAVNLGDMTFDTYWYSNRYNLSNYAAAIAEAGFSFPIYHVPGNHDNDERATGATIADVDFAAEEPYKRVLGPTYYSFNAGGVHFVMMDDTIYINAGASGTSAGDHSYNEGITTEQLNWLRKDLATLSDKTKPLVVGIHCPAHSFNSSFAVTSAQSFNAFNACLSGFSDVHILSGHTHNNYNLRIGTNMMEHNTAAVCATWWWTGYFKYPHVCKDGTPGGYGVYDFSRGALEKWDHHGIGYDPARRFRVYDVNRVKAWYASDAARTMLSRDPDRTSDYADFPDNSILVNVWEYDSAWKVEVSENGNALPVEHVYCRDPYHTMCYDAVRYATTSDITSSFNSGNNYHMFRAVASRPDATLEVRVTDRFGAVTTEKLTLPVAFSNDLYSRDWK